MTEVLHSLKHNLTQVQHSAKFYTVKIAEIVFVLLDTDANWSSNIPPHCLGALKQSIPSDRLQPGGNPTQSPETIQVHRPPQFTRKGLRLQITGGIVSGHRILF